MLYPENAPAIGDANSQAILSAAGLFMIGTGTDLSDIDLTSEALDHRVRFACASRRLYWAADGTLKSAAPNVWPLEYDARTGKPVGRTPPEPQVTNWQIESRGNNVVRPGNAGNFFSDPNSTIVTTGIGPDGGPIGELNSTSYFLYAVYNASNGSWLVNAAGSPPGPEWERIVMPFTLSDPANVRTYNARADSSLYVYGVTASPVPAGNVVASFFRRMNGSAIDSGLVQVESGRFATSPVITDASAVTRAAAFAYVLTQNANGMTVSYSDGTSEAFRFNGEYQYPLPNPGAHWGARYITRISYHS